MTSRLDCHSRAVGVPFVYISMENLFIFELSFTKNSAVYLNKQKPLNIVGEQWSVIFMRTHAQSVIVCEGTRQHTITLRHHVQRDGWGLKMNNYAKSIIVAMPSFVWIHQVSLPCKI